MDDFLIVVKNISQKSKNFKLKDNNKFYTMTNIDEAIIEELPIFSKFSLDKYKCYRKILIREIKKTYLDIDEIIKNILISTFSECKK